MALLVEHADMTRPLPPAVEAAIIGVDPASPDGDATAVVVRKTARLTRDQYSADSFRRAWQAAMANCMTPTDTDSEESDDVTDYDRDYLESQIEDTEPSIKVLELRVAKLQELVRALVGPATAWMTYRIETAPIGTEAAGYRDTLERVSRLDREIGSLHPESVEDAELAKARGQFERHCLDKDRLYELTAPAMTAPKNPAIVIEPKVKLEPAAPKRYDDRTARPWVMMDMQERQRLVRGAMGAPPPAFIVPAGGVIDPAHINGRTGKDETVTFVGSHGDRLSLQEIAERVAPGQIFRLETFGRPEKPSPVAAAAVETKAEPAPLAPVRYDDVALFAKRVDGGWLVKGPVLSEDGQMVTGTLVDVIVWAGENFPGATVKPAELLP